VNLSDLVSLKTSSLLVKFARSSLFGLVMYCSMAGLCAAQDHDVLCSDGNGGFQSESHNGVKVRVRAARTGGLATRACEASLIWDGGTTMITPYASQVDLDAFGVDLGLGVPVTALQLKKSGDECCMEYRVYSLEKPPRLLRTITGGKFFSAADRELDGEPEIWTNDAAALTGFEHLGPAELDAGPTMVLRFERGMLLDASSEFQPYYDQRIAELLQELAPGSLRDFKSSDGKLSPNAPFPAEQLQRLRSVKAKIIEIVWDYLYSGREQQAWRTLTEMWPAADVARIHTAIADARGRGITAQLDGVSNPIVGRRRKQVRTFDAIVQSASGKLDFTPPVPIMLYRPPLSETVSERPQSELLLELVIDSAGKVRSAEPVGKAHSVDAVLLNSVNDWRFVPAFRANRAVASRIRLAVSLRQ